MKVKSDWITYRAGFLEFPSSADYADIHESASASSENSGGSRKRLQDKRNTMCYRNGKIPRAERRMEALISKSVNIDKNLFSKKNNDLGK